MDCSLDPDALTDRLARWRALDRAIVSRRPTPTGFEVDYRLEPEVVDELTALLEAERTCCPAGAFTATVRLRVVSGTGAADDLAAALDPGLGAPGH
jgi:hypothetical protein